MSKCEHNDHSHWFLWLFVLAMALDCSGKETNQDRKIRDLEWQVQQLGARR